MQEDFFLLRDAHLWLASCPWSYSSSPQMMQPKEPALRRFGRRIPGIAGFCRANSWTHRRYGYLPSNFAARFSKNAAIPSAASRDRNASS